MSAVAKCAEMFAAVPRRTHSAAFDLHCCGLTIAEVVIITLSRTRSLSDALRRCLFVETTSDQ